jgi:hypothetical protein
MKTTSLLALVASCYAPGAFADVTFTFGNRIPGVLDAPIYGFEFDPTTTGDYADAKCGNTTNGIPSGTQVYKGKRLEGWSVLLAVAPGLHFSGNDLTPSPVTVTTGSGADAGYFPTTDVTFEVFDGGPGDFFTVQVRVWHSEGGMLDWGSAYRRGASALFTVGFGEVATGLRSFSLGYYDEATLTPRGAPPPGPPPLSYSYTSGVLTLWVGSSGRLYASDSPNGPWEVVGGGGYFILLNPSATTNKAKFYRAGY